MASISPASDLAARLAPVTLPSVAHGDVRLGGLWEDQTVVLVHLRHFG